MNTRNNYKIKSGDCRSDLNHIMFIMQRTKNIPVYIYIFLVMLSSLMCLSSCTKLIDVPPPTNAIVENNVYTSNATAISVLTALYSSMNEKTILNPFQGNGSIALFTGLSSDEFELVDGVSDAIYFDFYKNALQVNAPPGSGYNHWAPLYTYIFKCNAAIEGITGSNSLNPSVKNQLLGEAKFMRAFFYFYLVNLFGDVPLALTTDPEVLTLLARTHKTDVYKKIVDDLIEARSLLSEQYLQNDLITKYATGSEERVRPVKWAASALLARVYLFMGDFANAEAEASTVINNTNLYGIESALNNVFLKNSREAIFQLQPTTVNFNTTEAQTLVIPATGPIITDNPVSVSYSLANSFELNDLRAVYGNWIDTTIYEIMPSTYDTITFPYKYKINTSPDVTDANGMTEYFMVLRLAEQYLIRAEARVHQGKITEAAEDLNTVRNRAGLGNTTAANQDELLDVILNERRVEFFSEWGHRWLDLKRTGKIDEIMASVTLAKANHEWQSYQQLYPLPLTDIQKMPNLVQNPGY